MRAGPVGRRTCMESTNLADLYGSPVIDWGTITAGLDAGIPQAPGEGGPDRHTCWLATINDDGSPHLTGVGALWVDGTFWFETGQTSRKGRNLARDPRCALSVRDARLRSRHRRCRRHRHRSADGGRHGRRVGGRGLAEQVRRLRHRAHGRLQRTIGRSAAVVGVPHRHPRPRPACSPWNPAAPHAGRSETAFSPRPAGSSEPSRWVRPSPWWRRRVRIAPGRRAMAAHRRPTLAGQ